MLCEKILGAVFIFNAMLFFILYQKQYACYPEIKSVVTIDLYNGNIIFLFLRNLRFVLVDLSVALKKSEILPARYAFSGHLF